MIPFDFRLFGRLTYLAFCKSKNTDAPLTVRRAVSLLIGISGFLFLEIGNFLFLLLDEVFCPGYRRVEICRPVFIVGNPRSGTTFLHRVLSLDTKQFFGFRTWEILLPSIIQKRLVDIIARMDRFIGNPIRRLIQKTEKRVLGEFIEMHPTGLLHLEEDEMLLLHSFSSLYLVFFFPFYDELKKFVQFDQNMSPAGKKRIMEFYQRCLMRQAYLRGRYKTFLSKNPMFSSKIESLRQWFPGCRIIYMARNPLQAIPSMISEGHATCVFAKADQPPSERFQENVYETAKVFYRYPLTQMERNDTLPSHIINYHKLLANPALTITRLYKDLGLEMTQEFQALLQQEEKKAKKYKSRHRYSVEQFSITRDRIKTDFADIMDRFWFSDGEAGGP